MTSILYPTSRVVNARGQVEIPQTISSAVAAQRVGLASQLERGAQQRLDRNRSRR